MKFYALAFELVALNLILIVGGYYLDDYLSSSPAIILIATFLSMGGTIWILLKSLK
ncbi:AtpZ/AtpI family protein [Ekhidna sp.]